MSNEDYVRSVWEWVEVGAIKDDTYVFLDAANFYVGPNFDRAWSAAAEFTREHKEKVRQLREEIALVGVFIEGAEYGNNVWHKAVASRLLARLESALATLTQGMKAEAQQ